MRRIAATGLALLVTPLLSAGCNAILGIDEHKLTSPADAASDAGAGGPDVRIDVDSGSPIVPDGSTDATGVDRSVASDAPDTGATVADAGTGADGSDSGSAVDSGSTTGDGGTIGSDGGDAGTRIVVLRGIISTTRLAPAPAGNMRLVDHGIAVPWKSCNASNCVSGGIAP